MKIGSQNELLVDYRHTVARGWGILTWPQVGDFEVAIGENNAISRK
jgi:hypothetical protein